MLAAKVEAAGVTLPNVFCKNYRCSIDKINKQQTSSFFILIVFFAGICLAEGSRFFAAIRNKRLKTTNIINKLCVL